MRRWLRWSIVLCCAASLSVSAATSPAAAESQKPATAKKSSLPETLKECEVQYAPHMTFCATLTRKGDSFTRLGENGSVGVVDVQHWSDDEIVLKRTDSSGTKAGLSGTYTGHRASDGSISGTVTWQWPGHFETLQGTWSASVAGAASPAAASTKAGEPAANQKAPAKADSNKQQAKQAAVTPAPAAATTAKSAAVKAVLEKAAEASAKAN